MNNTRYQIFLSSTYSDLIDARNKVIEIILRMHHFPVGMEMFSADDSDQWEVIKETINSSDYYILLIGHRYGSETSEGISFTEKEFDYAFSSKIPILAFIRQRDLATTPSEREDDIEKTKKLNMFIEKAMKSRMCDIWENPDDLSAKVAVALQKIFIRHPRLGWIRSDKGYSPDLMEEMAKLSKENREMRDELHVIRGSVEGRKPILNVTINEKNSIKVGIPLLDESALGIISIPKPIQESDIPNHLKDYITSEDIYEYNESLPTKEIVDFYNSKISYYNIPGSTVMGIFNSTNPRKPSKLCYPTPDYRENMWANDW